MIDVTTMTRREARELTEKAIKTLHDAYRATVDKGPAATVKASIEAQGEDMTRYALYQIVNSRLMENRKTIISTNLSPDELGSRYGAAILSAQEGASLPANAFVVSAGTKAAHWRVEPDGATLRLRRTDGLTFVIR